MYTKTIKREVRIFSEKKTSAGKSVVPKQNIEEINCQAIDSLIAEGGSNFIRYLGWLNMLNQKNILLLSPKHHYFFDQTELKHPTILILLKRINQMENLNGFLEDISRAVGQGTSLMGHFFASGSKSDKPEVLSSIYNRLIDILDPGILKRFDSDSVADLIESHGFEVADMTLIKNSIYFRAIKK